MRRRGISPWLVKARDQIRTAPSPGVAHRIADGDTPIAAWRVECGFSINTLSRLTNIDGWRLIDIESGLAPAHADEMNVIATALRVTPSLLASVSSPVGD